MPDATSFFALIVEDNDEIAGIMQLALRRIAIDSFIASSGPAALRFLDEHRPDVMLLDINMPGMTGWEVLEAIKARDPEFSYPVIVLTALSDPANRLIGKLQKHVFRYLTKPFDIEVLQDTVREALGRQ